MSAIERIDRFQRAHPRTSLPLAVVYKFFDDQGTYLAAVIAYYGLLSIIPLLLVSSTVLGFVLHDNAGLQNRLVNSAIGQFPIVGDQLKDPGGISGSGIGLLIGIVGSLLFGLGVAQAAQNAMNSVWRVPRNERPNPFASRYQSLKLLGIGALSVVGTSALTGLSSALDGVPTAGKIVLTAGTTVLNMVLFSLGFQVATARRLRWSQVVPGAIGAAIVWQGLQYVGAIYVRHSAHLSQANGIFAIVLGLSVWIYLASLVVVFAVEFNTVRSLKLYPRALLTPFTDTVELTAADEASYTQQVRAQRLKGFQDISVRFQEHDTGSLPRADRYAAGLGADDGGQGGQHDDRPHDVRDARGQDAAAGPALQREQRPHENRREDQHHVSRRDRDERIDQD